MCHPFLLVLVFTPARMDAKVSCGWQNLNVTSIFADRLFSFYEKEALLCFLRKDFSFVFLFFLNPNVSPNYV